MPYKVLRSLVSQNGGTLFDYHQEGMLILNSSNRRIMHVDSNSAEDMTAGLQEQIQTFFNETDDSLRPAQKPPALIETDISLLFDKLSADAFFTAVDSLSKTYSMTLQFHFQQTPNHWQNLFEPYLDLITKHVKQKTATFQIAGPFDRMTNNDKSFLFDWGFQLFYVDYSSDCSLPLFDSVRGLVDYGFRVPFVWYVCEANVKHIPDIIESAMQINRNGGFTLPLCSENPYPINISRPGLNDYLQLLIFVYAQYRFYDDILYPLNIVLESSLSQPISLIPIRYRWDCRKNVLYCISCLKEVEQVHSFFLRSFIRQRWSLERTFTYQHQNRSK